MFTLTGRQVPWKHKHGLVEGRKSPEDHRFLSCSGRSCCWILDCEPKGNDLYFINFSTVEQCKNITMKAFCVSLFHLTVHSGTDDFYVHHKTRDTVTDIPERRIWLAAFKMFSEVVAVTL